jgi:hypothetical protein
MTTEKLHLNLFYAFRFDTGVPLVEMELQFLNIRLEILPRKSEEGSSLIIQKIKLALQTDACCHEKVKQHGVTAEVILSGIFLDEQRILHFFEDLDGIMPRVKGREEIVPLLLSLDVIQESLDELPVG